MFAVIGLVGLAGVLMVGSPRTPTVQLAGTQTLDPRTRDTTVPGESASGVEGALSSVPVTTAAAPATTATTVPVSSTTPPTVTLPGGAAAPAGVREVLRTEDSTSFTFDVPPELVSGSATAVPPTRVAFSADGNAVSVFVSCAASASEVLALVSVTEAEGSITVLAVVLVPDGGPPCDLAVPPREVTVPLAAPAAGRTLTVVPAGTAVPGFTTN